MTLSKLALTVTEDDINKGLEAAFEKMAEGPQGEALKSRSRRRSVWSPRRMAVRWTSRWKRSP